MSTVQTNWGYRLRGDPTRWLLDYADNPSVYYWFQRNVVGRPENAPALLEARDQILYSAPVQALFAIQDQGGFWESPTSLDLPRYRATLWSLALLAELGIPRGSRRARAACEFVLQNHLNDDGAFTGLRQLDDAGLLVRSLLYFLPGDDSRLTPALDRLAVDAAEGKVYALWALAENRPARYLPAIESGVNAVLDRLARGDWRTFGAFPPFEGEDTLLALRVLALIGRLRDPRANAALEEVWARQGEGGRWALDQDHAGMILPSLDRAGLPSKWATLYALTIVSRT